MTIILNHTIVPAREKVAAARFFAGIFGLDFNKQSDHFTPVCVNETLTLLFDEDTSFDSHNYAFHVNNAEFDAIFERIKKAGIAYGSAPWSLDDGKREILSSPKHDDQVVRRPHICRRATHKLGRAPISPSCPAPRPRKQASSSPTSSRRRTNFALPR
jgi:hypothetical protein